MANLVKGVLWVSSLMCFRISCLSIFRQWLPGIRKWLSQHPTKVIQKTICTVSLVWMSTSRKYETNHPIVCTAIHWLTFSKLKHQRCRQFWNSICPSNRSPDILRILKTWKVNFFTEVAHWNHHCELRIIPSVLSHSFSVIFVFLMRSNDGLTESSVLAFNVSPPWQRWLS